MIQWEMMSTTQGRRYHLLICVLWLCMQMRVECNDDIAGPQVAPQSVQLIAVNTECVQLSWQPPEYPNGPITGYQYICSTLSDWVTVPASENVDTICNLQPNQAIECMIVAMNLVGLSDGANSTATTPCAAPRLRDDWSSYITEEAYIPDRTFYHRRRFYVSVPSEVIESNCNNITFMLFGFRQIFNETFSTTVYITNNTYLDNLNASTSYVIHFTVRNDGNLETTERAYVTTGELEPGQVHMSYEVLDENCMNVNWSEPDPPNGQVLEYEHSCTVDEKTHQPVTVEVYSNRSIKACMKMPGLVIICEVKTSTALGFGPSNSVAVTVGIILVPPRYFYVSGQTTTSVVKLGWLPPLFSHRNLSISEYIIRCTVTNNEFNSGVELHSIKVYTSLVNNITIEYLATQVEYTCSVQYLDSNDFSFPAYKKFWTRPNELTFRWPSEEAIPAQTTVTVPLPIIESDPAWLIGYKSMQIVVQPTSVGQGVGLFPYFVDGDEVHVVADLPPSQLNSSFVVGDDRKNDRNKPLRRGFYNIYIGFLAHTEDVVSNYTVIPGAEAIHVAGGPPRPTEVESTVTDTVTPTGAADRTRSKANTVAIAVGVIVGVLVILCMVLAGLCFRKRMSYLNRQQLNAYHRNIGASGETHTPLGLNTIKDGNKPSFDKIT